MQPVTVSGLQGAVDIALGFDHTCAIDSSGEGWCWGRNNLGQLGINSMEPVQTASPMRVPNLGRALAIAAGAYHACAVIEGGAVQCWGQNNRGQLAYVNGVGVIVTFASTIEGLRDAVAITAGFEHSCALLASGTVLCWGRGDEGQLGNGATGNTNSPVTVQGITNATAISAGNYHTCARLADSQVRCWGRNDEGQLGNGFTADSAVPVDTVNDGGALDVSAGGFHSCLLASGDVRCWGRGDLGQIGNGSLGNRPQPQPVSGISTPIAVDAGRSHACAVLQGGETRCWGSNELGQLGGGPGANSALAVTTRSLNMEGAALAWSANASNVFVAMSGHARISGEDDAFLTARYGTVAAGARATPAGDFDGDAIADPLDTCPAFANPDQSDLDGNGIGDVCECGDQNGDARVDVLDLVAINLAIFNPALVSPLCDTNDDGRCDVTDVIGANAKIFGAAAHCSRHPTNGIQQ
jgi:alpha-tubulin suppressor-like RCC1 family protein